MWPCATCCGSVCGHLPMPSWPPCLLFLPMCHAWRRGWDRTGAFVGLSPTFPGLYLPALPTLPLPTPALAHTACLLALAMPYTCSPHPSPTPPAFPCLPPYLYATQHFTLLCPHDILPVPYPTPPLHTPSSFYPLFTQFVCLALTLSFLTFAFLPVYMFLLLCLLLPVYTMPPILYATMPSLNIPYTISCVCTACSQCHTKHLSLPYLIPNFFFSVCPQPFFFTAGQGKTVRQKGLGQGQGRFREGGFEGSTISFYHTTTPPFHYNTMPPCLACMPFSSMPTGLTGRLEIREKKTGQGGLIFHSGWGGGFG